MNANPLITSDFNPSLPSQANHASINTRGPLKEDWSKGCPLDWSKEERDEKCVSLQEAIWGTEVLQRLEKIKLKVDPHFMFNCNGCVGNNLKRDGEDTSAAPVPMSGGDDTSAAPVPMVSFVPSLFATAAIGAFLYF